MTLMSVVAIHFESGNKCAYDYISGLIYLTPAWIIFLIAMFYLLENSKIILCILIGTIIYMIIAIVTMLIKSASI